MGRRPPAAFDGARPLTLTIGEILDEGILLPVYGEKMAAAR
jgi:hypothetical protein